MRENKTLDFKFEIKQLSEDGTIEGYGAIFGNRDRHNDLIERGSFTNTLLESDPKKIKMLWQHDSSEPIGFWNEIKEDERGLYCKGQLLLELTKAKEVYKMLKSGIVDGLSIGYDTIKCRYEEDEDGDRIRTISEIYLWEISVVTFPANPIANITSIKSVSPSMDLPIALRDRIWSKTEAVGRIRAYTDSVDSPSTSYKKYFMYYDAENKENFGAYKLPFVDIINGRPYIVPRAVFAIAGGRGVVNADIPANEKEIIKGKVNSLYARFRKEFDDDTIVSPFEDKKSIIENWELKEFDKFLKNSSLSNSEIKIFRKRYLELHNTKTEEKIKTKSPAEIEGDKNKMSPEGATTTKKEESPEEKLKKSQQEILKVLQKYIN